ncbi:sulfatase [Tichowtungia aerotolerans]|uniref:Sulfatase-like hydrolase/transferase n=1 Tax=Tichowtungia aerotolerans TaxID=2697043 RepID=A0A6P1M8H9_9BACT|nr:sulfatase [Tichowtungia aerotolerans]QHI68834.1 sulfatase-like hydrolase/transferase [Tichowtungia aerotolerans]
MRVAKSVMVAGLLTQGVMGAPNVLFIAVDDLNTEVGFLGDAHAKTPNMDRLAEQSVVFRRAYCQSPICGPSRNSLLTGRYPHHTGLYSLDPMFRDVEALEDVVSLPQHFRKNGYWSATVGKIYHSKPDPESFDTNHGWMGAFGPFPEKTIHLDSELPVHPYYDWGAFLEDEETADYKVAQSACGFIEKAAKTDQPFFISVGFFRPHCPMYAPQKWFDLHPLEDIVPLPDQSADLKDIPAYGKKLIRYFGRQDYNRFLRENNRAASFLQAYRACVSFTDHCIGQVLDALEKSGQADNTIVVLFGDHGVQNGKKNLWYKRTLWEASTQVPLLIKPAGNSVLQTVQTPVGLIDIYPTLCELAGLEQPAGLEGTSLAGLMRGEKQVRAPVLSVFGPDNFALRSDRWRYIRYADGAEELYDHRNDPDERTNLALNPENASVLDEFRPQVPKHSEPFAPGSSGLGSGAFPGK